MTCTVQTSDSQEVLSSVKQMPSIMKTYFGIYCLYVNCDEKNFPLLAVIFSGKTYFGAHSSETSLTLKDYSKRGTEKFCNIFYHRNDSTQKRGKNSNESLVQNLEN